MMVHNIQIGVSVDEESITKSITEGAAKQIMAAIFPNGLNTRSYYGNKWSPEFETIVKNQVDAFLDSAKDQIIDKTAEMIAEKLARSTKFRNEVTNKAGDRT